MQKERKKAVEPILVDVKSGDCCTDQIESDDARLQQKDEPTKNQRDEVESSAHTIPLMRAVDTMTSTIKLENVRRRSSELCAERYTHGADRA